jgi:hypothetical protein
MHETRLRRFKLRVSGTKYGMRKSAEADFAPFVAAISIAGLFHDLRPIPFIS